MVYHDGQGGATVNEAGGTWLTTAARPGQRLAEHCRCDIEQRLSLHGADKAEELMTAPGITIYPDAPLAAAAPRMSQYQVRLLRVVTPEGDLFGAVSRRNLLSVFLRPDADIAGEVRSVLGDLLLIDESAVTVSAQDGTVTPQGQVVDEDAHRAAIRVAGEVGKRVAGTRPWPRKTGAPCPPRPEHPPASAAVPGIQALYWPPWGDGGAPGEPSRQPATAAAHPETCDCRKIWAGGLI